MVELQKDRITRGDFLSFGFIGAVMGAILTIPPAAFVLSPVIKTNVLGQSDVSQDWQMVGPIDDVPDGEPIVIEVDFPIDQIYGNNEVQEQFPDTQKSNEEFAVRSAIWLSWQDGQRPEELQGINGSLTQEQRQLAEENLNILSNICAHLGCPVRWVIVEGEGEFLCPCHGGIYDINGGYIGGPPPRGMFRYPVREVREDGNLYIRHEFDDEDGIPGLTTTRPHVV